jgi:hypothetical protein
MISYLKSVKLLYEIIIKKRIQLNILFIDFIQSKSMKKPLSTILSLKILKHFDFDFNLNKLQNSNKNYFINKINNYFNKIVICFHPIRNH